MAEKKQTIVIKKIIVSGGGHHGGSWKVALADFMTALMAFFLVMWLLGQSEETKKAVSDYFSTPSVIEYNFSNYGVELTLEKLFLDVLNEPLKAFQSFMEPIDKTPNLLDMGSAKVVSAYLADQMNDVAKNVSITPDGFDFDIPDTMLFERGSANPNASFVMVMDKIKGVTAGLKDADIRLTSGLFVQAVPDSSMMTAQKVAAERLDIVKNKILASLEENSVTVKGGVSVKEKRGEVDPSKLIGFIRVKVTQKEITSDGRKPRKLESLFGNPKVDMSGYDQFVDEISGSKPKSAKPAKESGAALKQQIDQELMLDTKIESMPTE
ncbi:Motility protein B [compost metagenome]